MSEQNFGTLQGPGPVNPNVQRTPDQLANTDDQRTAEQKAIDAANRSGAQHGNPQQQFVGTPGQGQNVQRQYTPVTPQGYQSHTAASGSFEAVSLQGAKLAEASTDPAELRLVRIELQLAEIRSELRRMGAVIKEK